MTSKIGKSQSGRNILKGLLASSTAILAALVTLSIGGVFTTEAGAAETKSILSTADAKIVQNASAENYGGASSLVVDGDSPSGTAKDEAALIKWDLSGIAPGTKLDLASVALTVTNSSPQTYQAYKLKRVWTESAVAWNASASGMPWEVPGAKGLLDREATAAGAITPSTTGRQTFAISPTVVQGWIDDPASNQGIIIANAANWDGFQFYSREAADPSLHPQLTLTLADPAPVQDPVLVGAGDISSCANDDDEATAKLLDDIPGTVYALGDIVYNEGSAAQFSSCYNPTWGRHKARTKPSVGNHEYLTPNASGYFGYFGAAAGDPKKGYYSYNLGAWHVVVLNSECYKVGGCGPNSPQIQWLKSDLATNPAACTLAYWHRPVFSSSTYGYDGSMRPTWDVLYANKADVVLNAHTHFYERLRPMNASGARDDALGIRQFIVGTGGASHHGFGASHPSSVVRNADTYGVLKLTLHPNSYDWQFVPTVGRTFTDSGSSGCH